jgi:hypothetical protein
MATRQVWRPVSVRRSTLSHQCIQPLRSSRGMRLLRVVALPSKEADIQ